MRQSRPFRLSVTTAFLLAASCVLPAAPVRDRDGDGMSDALEEALGSDPGFAETLEVVAESPAYEPSAERPAHFDIRQVRFGSAGRGRWLWAVEFAAPYTFGNTSILVYVDADNDRDTGRTGMGCEIVYGQRNGSPTQMFYLDEARRAEFPMHRVGLEDGVLYLCADVSLNQSEGRSRFRMQILSEQPSPHESRDSLGFRDINGPGASARAKIPLLDDLSADEGFAVTQDMALLWRLQADERNVILNSYRDCEYEGFEYNHSEYRWPSLRRRGARGTIRANVPEAGRFFPGVVVYDGPGPDNFELRLDGRVLGRFTARADNRRQRLFFLEKPVSLQAGQTLEFTGAGASCVVEDVVLLHERPTVLAPPCEVRNLEVGYDRQRDAMRATWTTTWPAVCTVDFGTGSVSEDAATQNHRVFLPALDTGKRYSCRLTAEGEGGRTVKGPRVRFTAGRPETPAGSVARAELPLTMLSEGGAAPPDFPLTAGIPFPRGVLGSAEHLRLMDGSGQEMPLQARALMHWPDGSVRVALLDTVVPAGLERDRPWTLEYGHDVRRSTPDRGIESGEATYGLAVMTRFLAAQLNPRVSALFTRFSSSSGPLLTREDAPPVIEITDADGKTYDTLGPPESLVVEESGPLRTVVRVDGHHTGASGRFFDYQIRFTFFAYWPGMKMSYRWGNDVAKDEFSSFRQIRLRFPLALGPGAKCEVGGDEAGLGPFTRNVRLEQLRDDRYRVSGQEGRRAPGWVRATDSGMEIALLCRQFWQLYPKAIGVEDGALFVDLCPPLAETEYADCSELDLIKLYYYLQDGRYKVRQGMTKVHDVWLLDWPDDGVRGALDQIAAAVNSPPVLVAPPEHYAASGVFGSFVPESAGRTPRYDDVCDRVYERYVGARDRGRYFGMLNFGDLWGERRVNWSNGEYDHHHTMAQAFVRSAEPRWYHIMSDAARHDIDVDLCHFHESARYQGASWIHSMGHSGRYFSKQYQGQWGTPGGGMSPTHTWCEGTCEYYALTGDPTAIEAARSIADHYGGTYLNHYDFTNGRVPGWHLLLTMAVYRATYDPFYLNAARIIVDRAMERRTPGSGWARQLVPGHCHCQPRCRGACSFMQGILGCGLREYYLETQDDRVPEAVVASARYVIEQLWVPEKEAFRYTSCPTSSVTTSRSDTLAGLLLFAHELSGDPAFADIVVRSMNLGFSSLGSVSHMRWTPYIVSALDRLHRNDIAIGGVDPTRVLLDNPDGVPFELRLSDRSGTGAPAGAAALSGPGLVDGRPDDRGRIRVGGGQPGTYELRIAGGSGGWLLTSSLNRLGIAIGDGLEMAVGEQTRQLCLKPLAGRGPVRISLTVSRGVLAARLLDEEGRVLTEKRNLRRGATLECEVGTEFCLLELSGPAGVRMQAAGTARWGSWSAGRFFNGSRPCVAIEGDPVVCPGAAKPFELRAVVRDPEDDLAAVHWELPGGVHVDGAVLSEVPAGAGSSFTVTAVAVDAEGNRGSTSVAVTPAPPELRGAGRLVLIQAEDFVREGKGEVKVYDRVGNVGRMITYWHAVLGHWLEWEVDLPVDGTYQVYARYATDGPASRRSLELDGKSPGPSFDDIRFEPTGGYCTDADNWRLLPVGKVVRLAGGRHTLRMTNLAEGLALDYLALVAVGGE